jgi:ribosomal protein S21
LGLTYKQERIIEKPMKRKGNVTVLVGDNIERALRQLKKKTEREGIVRDMKRLAYHETEAQKRRKKLLRAVKQNLLRMAAHHMI